MRGERGFVLDIEEKGVLCPFDDGFGFGEALEVYFCRTAIAEEVSRNQRPGLITIS